MPFVLLLFLIYIFQETVLLNPCITFSKKLILSVINKFTTGTESLALFIWNVALFVSVAATARTDIFASGSTFISEVLVISGLVQSCDHTNEALFHS